MIRSAFCGWFNYVDLMVMWFDDLDVSLLEDDVFLTAFEHSLFKIFSFGCHCLSFLFCIFFKTLIMLVSIRFGIACSRSEF